MLYHETKLGKLYNGDCLEVMDELIKEGVKVDAIICDPPYGKTQQKWDSIIDFDILWNKLDKLSNINSAIVLFGLEPFSTRLRMSNIKNYKYDWIWEKNLKTNNLNARIMPMGGHELISVFYKKKPTYNPQKRTRTTEVKSGNKKNSQTSVYGNQKEDYLDRQSELICPDTVIKGIKCVHNSSGKKHPNQKPVELIEYLIKTYSNEGDLILDFTSGSGTLAIVAENTNRRWICIEKDEDSEGNSLGYLDITVERLNEL